MVVFGHFVFNSLFTFLYVTCSFLDILQFLSISHLWIFRFTAHTTNKKVSGYFYHSLFYYYIMIYFYLYISFFITNTHNNIAKTIEVNILVS